MDATERALLSATVHDALADPAADADAVLADLGWLEMLDAEPRAAIEVVFRALGTTNQSASLLDDVVVSGLGAIPRSDLAVLLPAWGAWGPPGRVEGTQIVAAGLATACVADATELLVVCHNGSDLMSATVPISDVEVQRVRGVDPDAGLHTAHVQHAGAATHLHPEAWDTAVALAQRALAHQIGAASRAMLELACTHAQEREQFGRPVARFQAVRHRLAEGLVAIEALDAATTAAADEPNVMTAACAKAIAGNTARTVAAHAQQVLAGIGFTTEHPFHRFMKRTMVLDGILGSADELTVDIGRRLLSTRMVPTLVDL